MGKPKFWNALISPLKPAVTITIPQEADTFPELDKSVLRRFPLLFLPNISFSSGQVADILSKKYPFVALEMIPLRGLLSRSRVVVPGWSTGVGGWLAVETSSKLLALSWVAPQDSVEAIPGHEMAAETSWLWKCSYEFVTVTFLLLLLLLLLGREAGDSYFHMYTFESSLADTTYLPSAVIEAEIWLLVFRNPVK